MQSTVTIPKGRYKTDDVVWVHHWFTDDLTQVTIKGSQQGKIVVVHNVQDCPYVGAPDERINASQIVAKVSADWQRGVVPEGAEEVVDPGADDLAEAGGSEDDEVAQAEDEEVE